MAIDVLLVIVVMVHKTIVYNKAKQQMWNYKESDRFSKIVMGYAMNSA